MVMVYKREDKQMNNTKQKMLKDGKTKDLYESIIMRYLIE